MKTSESISKIAPALLAAQKIITYAAKDSANQHFKSTYANLESVIEAVKAPLNDHGIIFLQTFSPSVSGFLSLSTRLMHESGEWIEDEMTVPLQKNDAQGYGSAATYARRYSLAAITGLYQADDDGHEASKPAPKSEPTPAPVQMLTIDQVTSIKDAAKEFGVSVEQICKTGKVQSLSEIKASSYKKLLDWVKSQNKVAA